MFALGVASGDPGSSEVTLWTRLVRGAPLDATSMAAEPVSVRYEVAEDEQMRRIVSKGSVVASPEAGHAVHVRLQGLPSNRWFYYRFYALGVASRVGRTRTFPALHDDAPRLRFALASCQDYQNGYYSAYAAMLEEELDCVVHVGDYIYEYGSYEKGVRQVPDGEITSEFPAELIPQVEATLPSNPHLKFFEAAHHGYVHCDVTTRSWTTKFRGVQSVATPESTVDTIATFVIEEGRPGAQRG